MISKCIEHLQTVANSNYSSVANPTLCSYYSLYWVSSHCFVSVSCCKIIEMPSASVFCWWLPSNRCICSSIYYCELFGVFQYVTRLGAWAHYGMGYSMGVMFQMKYVITYGLSCTVARAEQMRAPNHPKCIGRIHLYSDMWRYFDQGLYFFLRKLVDDIHWLL
jgi:hypothetical protein